MKENFQISKGDPLEFSLIPDQNNGDLLHAIRIKLLSKEKFLSMVNGYEIRLNGIIEGDNKLNIIRYICDDNESTIEYLSTNNPIFYYGDKVEFSLKSGNKYATNVSLIERNRLRGWIAIIREGQGFIEQSNISDNIEPIAFTINSFTDENIQIDLGDEIEFSLSSISGQLTAENILKVPLTIQNSYVRSSK